PLHRTAAVPHRRALYEARQLARQIRRSVVAALLRQAGVAGQVQEADRRWPLQPAVEAGPVECHLEAAEDVAEPGVRLLAVVDRKERRVGDCREADSCFSRALADL